MFVIFGRQNPSDQGRSALVSRNYDVALIAPGPTVNEITYCIPNKEGYHLNSYENWPLEINKQSTKQINKQNA